MCVFANHLDVRIHRDAFEAGTIALFVETGLFLFKSDQIPGDYLIDRGRGRCHGHGLAQAGASADFQRSAAGDACRHSAKECLDLNHFCDCSDLHSEVFAHVGKAGDSHIRRVCLKARQQRAQPISACFNLSKGISAAFITNDAEDCSCHRIHYANGDAGNDCIACIRNDAFK